MDTNSIGAAIAQFRKKAGLTQVELAAKLNVSDKAVSRWENGLYIIVRGAMEASARALSKKYGVDLESILQHITDLLNRFTNAALKDTCKRVGGDPNRKLSPQDRLIGSSLWRWKPAFTPLISPSASPPVSTATLPSLTAPSRVQSGPRAF